MRTQQVSAEGTKMRPMTVFPSGVLLEVVMGRGVEDPEEDHCFQLQEAGSALLLEEEMIVFLAL